MNQRTRIRSVIWKLPFEPKSCQFTPTDCNRILRLFPLYNYVLLAYLFRTHRLSHSCKGDHSTFRCSRTSPRSLHYFHRNYLVHHHSSCCNSVWCCRSNRKSHSSSWVRSRHFLSLKAAKRCCEGSQLLLDWWISRGERQLTRSPRRYLPTSSYQW